MSEDSKTVESQTVGAEVVEEETAAPEPVSDDLINIACRVQNRDGSKGCGGKRAEKTDIPNGPTFYVCEDCGGRWIPVNVGGTFAY